MSIKLLLRYFLMIGLGLTLVACTHLVNSSLFGAPEPEPAPLRDRFQIAILLPGPKDDGSWSETGYEGGQLIQQTLKVPVKISEQITEIEAVAQFRSYAEAGMDFIIGYGGEFAQAAQAVAPDFPRTKFAVVNSTDSNNQNLGTISINAEESGYLAGAIAAIASKSQKVAYVAGISYPHIQKQVMQFIQGAQFIKPDIIVKGVFVESWNDAKKGTQLGQQLIDQGFDVIGVNADLAGLPIHTLAQKARVRTIGWVRDQHQLAPHTVITSLLENFPIALLKAASLAETGRWEGKQYKFGLQDGVNDLAPFYGSLSEAEIAQIDQIKENLMTGKISLLSVSDQAPD